MDEILNHMSTVFLISFQGCSGFRLQLWQVQILAFHVNPSKSSSGQIYSRIRRMLSPAAVRSINNTDKTNKARLE